MKKPDSPPTFLPLAREKTVRAFLQERRTALLNRTLREAAALAKCSDAWLCQLENGVATLGHIRLSSLDWLMKAYDLDLPTIVNLLGLCICQQLPVEKLARKGEHKIKLVTPVMDLAAKAAAKSKSNNEQ